MSTSVGQGPRRTSMGQGRRSTPTVRGGRNTSVSQGRPRTAPPRRTAPRRPVSRWTAAVAGVCGMLAIAAVILLPGGGQRGAASSPPPSTAVVARIDGQRVPVREFALYLAQERAATFAHFQQTYGAADGPHFWTTRYGGHTPTEYLRSRALTDVTRTTVVQRLAHRYGLLADPTYAGFLRDWTGENNRRRTALAAHRVIYGPVQYTEANYLTYVLNDLAFELEQKLSATGVLNATEGALRHYYDTHKGDLRQGAHAGAPVTTPSFSQARAQVRQMYLDDRYQSLVAESTRSAHVRIVRSVLAAVPVN